MNEEEKREYEELKSLLYTGTISQYGKRKLIDIIEKQQKEIEKLKSKKYILNAETKEIKEIPISDDYISKDKIKEKLGRIYAEYSYLLSQEKNNLDKINIITHQYNSMKTVLEELMEESNEIKKKYRN